MTDNDTGDELAEPQQEPLGLNRLKYKPRPKLDPEDPKLIEQMRFLGRKNFSHHAAAVALGVSRDTLRLFWDKHPQYREAFEDGKALREGDLRFLGDRHAITDPSTWRFLAKNELGLHDDPSKAKVDEAVARVTNMTADEARRRIDEMSRKVAMRTIEHQPEERKNAETPEQHIPRRISAPGQTRPAAAGSQGPQGGRAQGPGAGGGRERAASGGDPQAAARAQWQATNEGGDQRGHPRSRAGNPGRVDPGPNVTPVSAPQGQQAIADQIAKVAQRLAEIEASAVRKKPRADGQPHTDRTKAVAPDANSRQQVRDHRPRPLPGRAGGR